MSDIEGGNGGTSTMTAAMVASSKIIAMNRLDKT